MTNNVRDFTRLYGRRALHPGQIFLRCNAEGIFTDRNQATMLSAALDELPQGDLVQEVIEITLIEGPGGGLILDVMRYRVPKD